MTRDLFSSLDSFIAAPSSSLLVRDHAGEYRPAVADEVLLAAQRLLANQVRGSDVLASPAAVRDFLRARLGALPHEVFAIVHLDSQLRVLDYVEMFRGTVNQTSVYPREIVKEALPPSISVKLTFVCPASLKADLDRYAALHAQAYGETVDTVTLIPHMLEAFLAGDRGFRRSRAGARNSG